MERWQCIYTGMMDFLILCHIIYSDCARHRYGFLFTPVDGAVAVYLYWHDGVPDGPNSRPATPGKHTTCHQVFQEILN